MRISVSVQGWEGVIAEAQDAGPALKDEIRKAVRETAMEAVRNVKIAMPVDTGRARASWGSPEAEGIFVYEDDGFTNVQGTNVWYVERLNAGSSRQAPAGFIDAEEDAAAMRLAAKLEAALGMVFS